MLLPPWTRAPFLPFRQPAVILAVLGAAAILACASSSGLLFLSSAGAETLHRMLAAHCADAGFPTVRATNVVADPARGVPATRLPVEPIAVDDREVRAAMRGLGLAEPSRVLVSDQVPQVTAGGTSSGGLLFYRDGATGQITRVGRRVPGAGVWLPEQTAASLGVRPGATVALSATGVHSSSARVRVVGVYRDLFAEPIRPYWCAYATLFLYSSTGNDAYPPQPVIATDVADLRAAAGRLRRIEHRPLGLGGRPVRRSRCPRVGRSRPSSTRRTGGSACPSRRAWSSGPPAPGRCRNWRGRPS